MSYISDLDHMKLDATVYPDRVVQRQYVSDTNRGQRRVPKTKVWNIERILGTGTFGEVRLERCLDTNEHRAVKRVLSIGSVFETSYKRELKALLEFSKPKYRESAVFVHFLGWFEDAQCIYLAMEYMPLGDLEDNVKALGGTIREIEVRDITAQVLEGLRIMHLEKFAHRDLKPKNILICQGPPRWWVKLADFGLSKRRTEESAYKTQMGTFGYMAPEILNYLPEIKSGGSKYTNAVDIWALGCIVFRLITGAVPFPLGPSLGKFCGDETVFPSQPAALSELGYKFAREVLVARPSQRLTAEQALGHAWMKVDSETFRAIERPAKNDLGPRAGSVDSVGGYNTATHAGLQSYQPSSSGSRTGNSTTKPKAAGMSYHAPTVEDEAEEIRPEDLGMERKEVEDNVSATESDHEDSSGSSISYESDSDPSGRIRASAAAAAGRAARRAASRERRLMTSFSHHPAYSPPPTSATNIRSPSPASRPTTPPHPENQRGRKKVQPDNDRGRERGSTSPATVARAEDWRRFDDLEHSYEKLRSQSTDSSRAVKNWGSAIDTDNVLARFERFITAPQHPAHNSNEPFYYEDGLFDSSPNIPTLPNLNGIQARRLHQRFDRLRQYDAPVPGRQQVPLEAPSPSYDPSQIRYTSAYDSSNARWVHYSPSTTDSDSPQEDYPGHDFGRQEQPRAEPTVYRVADNRAHPLPSQQKPELVYRVADSRAQPFTSQNDGQLGTSGERPTFYADEMGFIEHNLHPRMYDDISSSQSTANPAPNDRSKRRNRRDLQPPSRPIVVTARPKLPREGLGRLRGQEYFV